MHPLWIIVGLVATVVVCVLHVLLSHRREAPGSSPAGLSIRLLYAVFLASIVALAGTAFYGVLGPGHLGGWLLFVHVTAAGVFVVSVAVLGAVWLARRIRFAGVNARHGVFTVVLVAAGVTVGTALVVMLPTTGSDQQRELLVAHGYAGLTLAICTALHATMSATVRRRG